jgi:hypothetical protein
MTAPAARVYAVVRRILCSSAHESWSTMTVFSKTFTDSKYNDHR